MRVAQSHQNHPSNPNKDSQQHPVRRLSPSTSKSFRSSTYSKWFAQWGIIAPIVCRHVAGGINALQDSTVAWASHHLSLYTCTITLICLISMGLCHGHLLHAITRLYEVIVNGFTQAFASLFGLAKQTRRSTGNTDVEDVVFDFSKRAPTLAITEPFLSKEKIASMTLRDIADVFLYASRVNQTGFDRDCFFCTSAQRATVKHAIHALDCATLCSRGPNTVLSEVPADSSSGSMDALLFCGAVRIYAEWRSLRGIPDGYPKFGFGMNMARRDLIQNLDKIEQAVHAMLDAQQDGLSEQERQNSRLSSPTLKELLEYELGTGVHRNLPSLLENSAGSGILWTKRQICYQSSTFDNNSKVPIDFPTPKAAFYAAYESVYGEYHGFLTRTFFQSTIDSAPPAHVVTRHMNIPYAQQAESSEEIEGAPTVDTVSDDGDNSSEETTSERSPTPRVAVAPDDDEHVDLGDKLAQIFSSVFGPCVAGDDDNNEQEDERNAMSLLSDAGQKAMEQNDCPHYLSVLRPLEAGWDQLIADLGMNDPARV